MKQPDNDTLKNWLAGELDGTALQNVEAWADANPDKIGELMAALDSPMEELKSVPSSVEIPYPEFFHSKLEQEIHHYEQEKANAKVQPKGMSLMDKLKFIFMPIAAAAMVLCFFLGMQFSPQGTVADVAEKPETPAVEANLVYVPNEEVTVEQFSSEDSSAIVLEGLEPIGDNDMAMLSVEPKEKVERFIAAVEEQETWY